MLPLSIIGKFFDVPLGGERINPQSLSPASAVDSAEARQAVDTALVSCFSARSAPGSTQHLAPRGLCWQLTEGAHDSRLFRKPTGVCGGERLLEGRS